VADLAAVHDRLRAILAPYRDSLVATKDGPGGLSLEIPGLEGKPWGYVAGTRLGKRYVSYYLMPVYASAELTRPSRPSCASGCRASRASTSPRSMKACSLSSPR
jgi:hypothetical protein